MAQRRGRHVATLARCPGGVEEVRRGGSRRGLLRALALATFALGWIACLSGVARAEPAFGDSDWVAPFAGANPADPGDPGPRVAKPDHDPLGVTILRLPFRAAFLPLRLIARGAEKGIGRIGPAGKPASSGAALPHWKFEPIVDTAPGAGLRVTRRLDPRGDANISATGSYAWNDRRRARLAFRTDPYDAPRGFQVVGSYSFRPNTKFYGVGNSSERGDKSIWLEEESRVDAVFHVGKPIAHELRLLGGYSQISARSGFNAPAGVPRIEDQFTPAEVPFLLRGSRVLSFGLAADLGLLDDIRSPSRGVAARLRAEQFKASDTSGLDYLRYHTEVRAYLPVFVARRMLALRILHDWVDPKAGSAEVPHYRLPETNDELRFNGYQTHRFTDRHLVLAQAEYRWWLSNRVFAVLNANAGEVASSAKQLRLADRHQAFGVGLRYGNSDRFSARADAAKGSEGLVLNLTLEDTF